MDKSTLSNYGWVVIVTLVLSVMLAFATPFGSYVARATANVIKYYKTVTGDTFNADYIEGQQNKWDDFLNDTVLPEDIEENEHMYGIGKTKREYVIAEFNDDYSSVTIYKNGVNSDGLMMDFDIGVSAKNLSPMKEHQATLKSIIVEEGVVSIGKQACRSLGNATKLKLPQSLKIIEYCAFNGCKNLTNIEIPNQIEYIGNYAFYCCRNAGDINISATATHIGDAAFSTIDNCTKITVAEDNPNYTSIDGVVYNKDLTILVQYPGGKTNADYTILSSTKKISIYAFAENSFLQNVTYPEGLTTIDSYAFYNVRNINNITLPSTVTSVGPYAYRYSLAKGVVSIPKNLTAIGTGAFATSGSKFEVDANNPNYKTIDGVLFSKDGKTLLAYPCSNPKTNYTVPEGTIEIGANAFLYTQYLTNINISNTVTKIGNGAFSNGLKQNFVLTIPQSVTMISDDAFIEALNPIIQGKTGSQAEIFANKNNITFVAI